MRDEMLFALPKDDPMDDYIQDLELLAQMMGLRVLYKGLYGYIPAVQVDIFGYRPSIIKRHRTAGYNRFLGKRTIHAHFDANFDTMRYGIECRYLGKGWYEVQI